MLLTIKINDMINKKQLYNFYWAVSKKKYLAKKVLVTYDANDNEINTEDCIVIECNTKKEAKKEVERLKEEFWL